MAMGRPKIEIDKKMFENLCAIHCTEVEIADIFECSIDTVNNWCKRTYGQTFSDTYKRKSAKGKASLRRLQWKSAECGNVSMQIWLGKQMLNQSDRVETDAPDTNISINVLPATENDVYND